MDFSRANRITASALSTQQHLQLGQHPAETGARMRHSVHVTWPTNRFPRISQVVMALFGCLLFICGFC